MQDESKCGYGATVESRDKDWLRVGALIGIKSHDAATWQLGIVRRLARLNDDTSSVGIETLAETPVLAMLNGTAPAGYTVNGLDNSGASLPYSSLWLTSSAGVDSVIIDPVHFTRPFHARQGSADPWRAGTQARCAGQPDRAQRRLDARCRRAGKRLIP